MREKKARARGAVEKEYDMARGGGVMAVQCVADSAWGLGGEGYGFSGGAWEGSWGQGMVGFEATCELVVGFGGLSSHGEDVGLGRVSCGSLCL